MPSIWPRFCEGATCRLEFCLMFILRLLVRKGMTTSTFRSNWSLFSGASCFVKSLGVLTFYLKIEAAPKKNHTSSGTSPESKVFIPTMFLSNWCDSPINILWWDELPYVCSAGSFLCDLWSVQHCTEYNWFFQPPSLPGDPQGGALHAPLEHCHPG